MPRLIEHDTLEITVDVENGCHGVDSSRHDPLSRGWRVLLQEGRSVRATSLCIYAEDVSMQNPRWLGMLALSEQRRVIFFPGLSFQPEWIRSGNSQKGLQQHAFAVDHLTLERSGRDWHFTTIGSDGHHPGGRAKVLSGEYVSWFGMTIASRDALASVRRRTLVRAAVPSNDLDRRYRMLRPLMQRMPQHLISLDERASRSNTTIHFSFVVSSADAAPYQSWPLDLPFGSPFLSPPLPDLPNLPVSCHPVPLGEDFTVHILATTLPSVQTLPVAFATRR